MRRVSRALGTFVITVVVGGILIGICVAALFPGLGILATATDYTTKLVTDLRDLSERSTVYDAQGNEIGVLGLENRENISIDQVPQSVIDAVVATEDKTFWENEGVDLPAVARAALKNLTSGAIEQGGSTISQQLVKNRILSPRRDLNRKIREVLLAIQLNKDYSKPQILEQYLNTVYFGQGSYGIKAAVERLLLKPDPDAPDGVHVTVMDEVSIGEAALLAGLIRSPELYNPFLHPDDARARRSVVLGQMHDEGYITSEEMAAAEQEPMPSILPSEDLRPRDSWVEEVQDRLFNDPKFSALGDTKQEREDAILRGGLQIHTTLDPVAQANAQHAVNEAVPLTPGFSAALVAMDPTTGAVRAMVSGADFESSQYNIATSYPGRQAGSTWKMITLSAAMQAHFSANDRVDATSPCDFGYPLGQTQNAGDGSGEGVISLRGATVGSVNCAYARIELAVGFNRVIDMARKLGITQDTLIPILTLTLGAIEATPLEMATVASSIASMGQRHDPYFVERIVNPEGLTIYQEQHPGLAVLDADAAACVVDQLRGVVSGGTGTRAQVPGWQIAGKTGTTDQQADAWFVGMTPKLVAAVWHGNPEARVRGAGYGGNIPASIFREFMTPQLATLTPEGWPRPPGWCYAPGFFLSEAGRGAVPEGFEILDGKLVPVTTTPPTAVVNPPTTTEPTKKDNKKKPSTTTTTKKSTTTTTSS